MSSLFYTLFPTPALLHVPHAGLDITDDTIRVVRFTKKGGHTSLGIISERSLPAGIVDGGYIVNEQVLIAEIRALCKDLEITHVQIALPEEKMYVFSLEVTGSTEEEIRSSIEFHLEENVPFPPAQAVFEYEPIEWKDGHCTKVSVTVYPNKTVDTYLSVVEGAGLKVIGCVSLPQAIVRAVVPAQAAHALLVVHISEMKTSVTIVVDGVVRFSSTVAIGSSSISEAVKKAFNISGPDAEHQARVYKQQAYLDVKKGRDVFNASMNTFSAIKDEVQKICLYWETHSHSTKITEVLLSGHDVTLPGLDMYISSTIKVPVRVANVWVHTGMKLPVKEIEFAQALDYPAAIGLALNV